jgi:hypothetical protein
MLHLEKLKKSALLKKNRAIKSMCSLELAKD